MLSPETVDVLSHNTMVLSETMYRESNKLWSFNAEAFLVEERKWNNLSHGLGDKVVHAFQMVCITPKVTVIA